MTTVNVCRHRKRARIVDFATVVGAWFVFSLPPLVFFLVMRPVGMTRIDQIGWSGIGGLLFMVLFGCITGALGHRHQMRKEIVKARVRSRLRERSRMEPHDGDSPHVWDTREALAKYFDVSPNEIQADDDLQLLLENDSLDRRFDRTLEVWVLIQLLQKHELTVKAFRLADDQSKTVGELANACQKALQEAERWPAK